MQFKLFCQQEQDNPNKDFATILAEQDKETQMTMQTTPHKNAHYPIPTEEGLKQILDIIVENKDNPKKLAKLEEEIPPHIMEALETFSQQELQQAKKFRQETEMLLQQTEALKQSIMQRIASQAKSADR